MHSGVLSSLSQAYTIPNVSDPLMEAMLNVERRDSVRGCNHEGLDNVFLAA